MSREYTTGEMAKACKVSVRTVQYYDSRGILKPDALSEGGRRVYSEESLKRLRTICFLRDIGMSISHIGKILKEEDPQPVIEILLENHTQVLREEIRCNIQKLRTARELARELEKCQGFSHETIEDIAYTIENQKKLRKVHRSMVAFGIPASLLQVGGLILGIVRGVWWPLALALAAAIGIGIWITKYYYDHVAYLCPQCRKIFRPGIWQFIFSAHTPKTRKLTCPYCKYRGYSMEVYRQKGAQNL